MLWVAFPLHAGHHDGSSIRRTPFSKVQQSSQRPVRLQSTAKEKQDADHHDHELDGRRPVVRAKPRPPTSKCSRAPPVNCTPLADSAVRLWHRGQHSTTLTASPPRLVSLYLSFMSRPVSRMVLMTLSSDTRCLPSLRIAMRWALMAFTEPIALRSMQGICTSPPMGSQVRPRLCSMPISAAFST